MATTVVKNYNVAPYYDDYDETKNFHRILFKPGYSVQARELTQLQTALQAQIDRYGQFAFKDGSRVVNGKATVDVNYDYIKIESTFWNGTASVNASTYLDDLVGTTITGTNNTGDQVTAVVQEVIPAVNSTTEPNTLYIKYTGAGSTGVAGEEKTITKFVAGELAQSDGSGTPFIMVGGGSNVDNSNLASTITDPIGIGSTANVEEGVYFISGSFVYVPGGSVILDKYSNTPSYIIGLKVTESTISSDVDNTLVDNAQGSPNYSAPGADRYKISTTLIKEPLDIASRTENSYITLLVIEDGKTTSDKTDKNSGTELSERLARRTFEESGDYTVNPYQLNIREHLDDEAGNNGYLTSANGGDADKLAIGIEKNVAYVKGFRIETNGTKYLEVNKPRGDDAQVDVNQAQQTLNVGNYIEVNESGSLGMPDIINFDTVDLHDTTNGGGTVRGTAKVRGVSQGSSSTKLYLYLFDINFNSGYTMADIASVVWDDNGTVKFRANLGSDKTIKSTGFNSLVYKLPFNAIATLRDPATTADSPDYNTSYVVRKTFTTDTGNAADTITGASFINASGVVAYIKDGSTYGELDANPTCTISGGGSTITFTTVNGSSVSLTGTQQIEYTVDVSYTGASPKTKTNTNRTITGSLTNGELSLGKPDIIKINAIKVGSSSGTDVTNLFTLDNGQRESFYGLGKIILKPGESDPGSLYVDYNYYVHSGSSDFFSVDSYVLPNPAGEYDNIPTFSGTNGTLELRDCIDFRPSVHDDGTFTGANVSLSSPPSDSNQFITDLTHYLPRIDKLYVTRRGEFKVAVGVPDSNPKPPAVPDDAMGIYNLRLAPYIFSLSGVKPQLIENKRFTMRDIGALEKRVKNLEYFTSLSLLEQSAADVDLTDSGGTTRLKNGFIVDNFTSHGIGDPSNPDYNCSIDRQNGILRPKFDERNVNLIRAAADTGTVVVNDGLATMPMNADVNYVNQPYASTFSNVNPYNVFSWAGTIKLSPDSDEWKETDVRPTVTVDDSASFDQFKKLAEETGILGTVWNEWETNWTGIDIDEQTETTGTAPGRRGRNFFGLPWWLQENEREDFFDIGTAGGGNQTTITTTTTTTGQSRDGIQTDLAFDTISRTDGGKVVEVNFVPFIRSRKIFFKAELLKPNTQVYAFFDGTPISSYVKEETFTEFSTRNNVTTYEGQTTHPGTAGSLISNSAGVIEGSFIIPRNDALKFATGSREFRLTDSSTNNKQNETTYAEAQYHAQGLLESVEETIVSTKVPRLATSELREDRTLVDTRVSETTTWVDPVAETFLVDKEGGIMLKSVDLYLRSIDQNIPIRVSIRTTLNGTPTQKIVPGADKILYPSDIATQASTTVSGFSNANATTATNFAFDFPIYLAQDTEYAVVITSQSDSYEVYVAEMGGFDITDATKRITKQPYNGVFFSSQNASTWTPEQSKDLKFRLNRASFNTSSSSKITFVNDVLPTRTLQANPFFFTSGSTAVKVFHKNHGMYNSADSVTISGVPAGTYNGINATELGTTAAPVRHSISNVTHDSYEITVSTTATGTSAYGGGSTVQATENRHMDLLYPVIQNMQVPGTSCRFFLKTYTTSSVDGDDDGYTLTTAGTDGYEILPNRNFYFPVPQAIFSGTNEEFGGLNSVKSFQLTAVMTSTNEALSPVIDMNRLSANTIQNIVTSNDGSEAVTSGGAEISKYITKKIELAEQADIATVFVNVLKPGGSDVNLYWRALNGDGDINSVAWTLQTPVGGAIPFNATQFQEVQFDIDPFGLNASFSAIQFKLVLKAENTSQPPMVKDFRAICAT
jgi:hypothetical protein